LRFEIIGYGAPDWVTRRAASMSNVRLCGKVPPIELVNYVRGWDGAMIPFKNGTLADAVDPIKIYEYLYWGLPVVVTGIRHLAACPMTIVSEPGSFGDSAMATAGSEFDRQRAEEFLKGCTWAARFDLLSSELRRTRLWGLYGD
jgi:hypothetical protein